MKTFTFKKALMQEQFNTKYVDSKKFPFAIFKGVINEAIDLTKDGVFEVTATGILNIHGIDKQITEIGTITIKSGKFNIKNEFLEILAEQFKLIRKEDGKFDDTNLNILISNLQNKITNADKTVKTTH